ncbi:MAG: acyltransferase [Archangium sp.]
MTRLPGLDTLRAIAILWVMLFHAGTLGLGWPGGELARFGWMGVDLFFVLSGFLIGAQWFASLRDGTAKFGAFYARRAWRIFPAYLAVLALYLLVPATQERAQMMPAWQFLTFTENLFIDFSSGKTFSHVWSLCVEEHFYLAFPLLTLALWRRVSLRGTVALCIGVVLAGMAWRGWVWLSDVSLRSEETQGQFFYQRIYYPTWSRLDGLVMGVVLAAIKVWRPAWWAAIGARRSWFAAAGFMITAAAIWLFAGDGPTTASVVLGYPLLSLGLAGVVAACAFPQRHSVPGAAFIAALSYSLYLSHKQAMHLVKSVAFEPLAKNDLLAFAVYGAAVFALGALVHFAIERPGLALRDARRARTVAV